MRIVCASVRLRGTSGAKAPTPNGERGISTSEVRDVPRAAETRTLEIQRVRHPKNLSALRFSVGLSEFSRAHLKTRPPNGDAGFPPPKVRDVPRAAETRTLEK